MERKISNRDEIGIIHGPHPAFFHICVAHTYEENEEEEEGKLYVTSKNTKKHFYFFNTSYRFFRTCSHFTHTIYHIECIYRKKGKHRHHHHHQFIYNIEIAFEIVCIDGNTCEVNWRSVCDRKKKQNQRQQQQQSGFIFVYCTLPIIHNALNLCTSTLASYTCMHALARTHTFMRM